MQILEKGEAVKEGLRKIEAFTTDQKQMSLERGDYQLSAKSVVSDIQIHIQNTNSLQF